MANEQGQEMNNGPHQKHKDNRKPTWNNPNEQQTNMNEMDKKKDNNNKTNPEANLASFGTRSNRDEEQSAPHDSLCSSILDSLGRLTPRDIALWRFVSGTHCEFSKNTKTSKK
jgi:hypothetical protein